MHDREHENATRSTRPRGVPRAPVPVEAMRRRRVAGRLGIAVLILAGCGSGGRSTTTTPTPTTPTSLGSTQGQATGRAVDGIQCPSQEQVLFHIHAHLAVFVGGRRARVPYGIGIAPPQSVDQSAGPPFVASGSCFYWLHSHTEDGVIHIESPIRRTFTLGNYFDIWNQPLSATRVAGATGPVTAYLDGRPFSGDPRTITLGSHAVIQLDVAGKVAPEPYAFASGL